MDHAYNWRVWLKSVHTCLVVNFPIVQQLVTIGVWKILRKEILYTEEDIWCTFFSQFAKCITWYYTKKNFHKSNDHCLNFFSGCTYSISSLVMLWIYYDCITKTFWYGNWKIENVLLYHSTATTFVFLLLVPIQFAKVE